MLYLTAFITGLFGSFHCAGMCGPIAFALPGNREHGLRFYTGRLINNAGRIFTYAILGLISGTFGLGLKLAGIQQGLSITAGIIIIITVILNRSKFRLISFNPLKMFSSKWVQKLFGSKSIFALFLIGLLNGLLPCGFVYIALIAASATQGIMEGAVFMIFFGLGTLPMMYIVGISGQFLTGNIRNKLTRLSPYLALLIGGLFILRGLNMGIPYLSPKLNNGLPQTENCR